MYSLLLENETKALIVQFKRKWKFTISLSRMCVRAITVNSFLACATGNTEDDLDHQVLAVGYGVLVRESLLIVGLKNASVCG